MSVVSANMSMSLDGFIADADHSVGRLFDWYQSGESRYAFPDPRFTAHVSVPTVRLLKQSAAATGAVIIGRRVFDQTHGWGGNHPVSVPVFVVTHSAPVDWPKDNTNFTFVTDGVASAVTKARECAPGKVISVAGASIVQQLLDARLLDELVVNLVPIVLGGGTPLFAHLAKTPIRFCGPTRVVDGAGVTHLTYSVDKS